MKARKYNKLKLMSKRIAISTETKADVGAEAGQIVKVNPIRKSLQLVEEGEDLKKVSQVRDSLELDIDLSAIKRPTTQFGVNRIMAMNKKTLMGGNHSVTSQPQRLS